MTTGHIMMAMTLDGFIARKDHSLDWLLKLETEGENHGFTEFQNSIDVIVMGTGSFRTVLGFSEWAYFKPVVVLSRTLTQDDIPDQLKDKVEISRLSPDDLMAAFESRGVRRVYVDGAAIIQSFMRAGHIVDMRLAIAPVLIGEGIRLFGDIEQDVDLTPVEVNRFKSGLVTVRYKVG